jgi:cell division protein FtsI (penicillin-binding protein 3)
MDVTAQPQTPYDPIRWKAGLLILVFSALFLIIAGRLFWVQVAQSERYRELARKQYESRVALRAERGRIYDRGMHDVATMIRTTSFAVDPTVLQQPERIASLLALATGQPAANILARIRQQGGRFVWLARGVNTVLYPDLDTLRDPGLIRVQEPKRNYVYGTVAAQLVGATSVDNIGLSGIELEYEELLRGTSGFVVMQRDGKGRLRPSVNPERQAAQNGKGLQLTIDMDVQRVVEQELARGVREAGATSGTVVAIEPSTGEILAMASFPTFDPSRLHDASSDAIRIRAVTDVYEPGSTLKAVTAAALIQERAITPSTMCDGRNGILPVEDRVVRDDHPVGRVTFADALAQSSNVVFATESERISDRVFYKYVRDFGFGIPLGIDLPGEVRGVLKRPDEFETTTKTYMAFGYQVSGTALQMVNAYATIANGGVMMQPHLVRAILSDRGAVEREVKPQRIRRVISDSTARALTEMLVGVVERGTGSEAKIDGVRIAGKTGTAQQLTAGAYDRKNYTASFVGFFPADAPRVAMIVMLDRPQSSIYGGTTAAPIFKRIVQKTMTMLSLDQQTRRTISRTAARDTSTVPDLRGLNPSTADSLLQRIGLRLEAPSQEGLIVGQQPTGGARVERGAPVRVSLQQRGASLQRPDVKGLPLRRAVAILQGAGVRVVVRGSGRVVQQVWEEDRCVLIASE